MDRERCVKAVALLGAIVISLSPLFGESDKRQEAEALLARAREHSDIRCEGCAPYLLKARVRFLTSLQGPVEGTYDEVYRSEDEWRRVLQVPEWKFVAVEIKKDKRMYRASQVRYPTYLESQLRNLLNTASHFKTPLKGGGWSTKKVNISGRSLTCAIHKAKGRKTETCFETSSGVLASWKTGPGDNSRTFEYFNYSPFSGKQFPRLLRLNEQKRATLEVEVDELSRSDEVNPALFIPPHNAEGWNYCEDPTLPEAIAKPEPPYPAQERAARVRGKVVVYVVVGPDGRAYSASPIRAEALSLAKNTLDTIEHRWRFKPATCNGSPIPWAILVETQFNVF